MSNQYYIEHKNEIFKKYSKDELIKDINNYINGSGNLNKTLNHFFEECIFECKAPRGNKSPMEALNCDNDIQYMLDYISTKTNFYTGNDIANIKSFFRNAGKLAQKVANFCPKNARDIQFRYFDVNGSKINILDTSAGFGSRMSSAILYGHNYIGFDPNVKLYNKLLEYYKFIKENIKESGQGKVYCQGSEIFIPALENKFDVSFTSPPYFNLEIYANDNNESTKNYNNYNKWIENFAIPTINNTYKYLKIGGYAMINIKNLTRGGKQSLFDDWFNIFENNKGFKYVETFEINHQAKKNYTMNCNYAVEKYTGFKEPVMSFQKVK